MRTAESVVLTLWPPGPGRAVDVDLEVVLVDLDLDLLGLGHHGDGGGRGVDPPLRLGLGNALDAVRAALVLEDGVGAVALDGEDDLLEAAGLALVRREDLGLEAAPLGVAGQHPVDVAGPDRGLVAADALPHLDDHVLRVGRVALDERELQLLLELARRRLESATSSRSSGSARASSRSARICRHSWRACRAPRAPSGGGRRPRPRGGRCRRPGRTGAPAARVGALELVDELVDAGHRAMVLGRRSSSATAAGRVRPWPRPVRTRLSVPRASQDAHSRLNPTSGLVRSCCGPAAAK